MPSEKASATVLFLERIKSSDLTSNLFDDGQPLRLACICVLQAIVSSAHALASYFWLGEESLPLEWLVFLIPAGLWAVTSAVGFLAAISGRKRMIEGSPSNNFSCIFSSSETRCAWLHLLLSVISSGVSWILECLFFSFPPNPVVNLPNAVYLWFQHMALLMCQPALISGVILIYCKGPSKNDCGVLVAIDNADKLRSNFRILQQNEDIEVDLRDVALPDLKDVPATEDDLEDSSQRIPLMMSKPQENVDSGIIIDANSLTDITRSNDCPGSMSPPSHLVAVSILQLALVGSCAVNACLLHSMYWVPGLLWLLAAIYSLLWSGTEALSPVQGSVARAHTLASGFALLVDHAHLAFFFLSGDQRQILQVLARTYGISVLHVTLALFLWSLHGSVLVVLDEAMTNVLDGSSFTCHNYFQLMQSETCESANPQAEDAYSAITQQDCCNAGRTEAELYPCGSICSIGTAQSATVALGLLEVVLGVFKATRFGLVLSSGDIDQTIQEDGLPFFDKGGSFANSLTYQFVALIVLPVCVWNLVAINGLAVAILAAWRSRLEFVISLGFFAVIGAAVAMLSDQGAALMTLYDWLPILLKTRLIIFPRALAIGILVVFLATMKKLFEQEQNEVQQQMGEISNKNVGKDGIGSDYDCMHSEDDEMFFESQTASIGIDEPDVGNVLMAHAISGDED